MQRKQQIIAFVLVLYAVMILYWNAALTNYLPYPDAIAPLMLTSLLWQQWNLFAPNPHTSMITTEVHITTTNYSTIIQRPYVTDGMPIHFSRLRKFDEKIIEQQNPNVIAAYLRFLCQEYHAGEEVILTLVQTTRPIGKTTEYKRTLGELTCA